MPNPAPAAQPAATPAPQAAAPDRITITGSLEAYDARREETVTKIVVNQKEIAKYGDPNLSEVLKRVPGVTIGGLPGKGQIRLRGLGNGYTQILLNGEPMPPGLSIDSIPPASVERIEIIPSATAEMSTQGIAGTINIVLVHVVRKAQRSGKLGVQTAGGKVSEMSSFQLSDKDGGMSYSVSGALNHFVLSWPQHIVDTESDSQGQTVGRRETELADGTQITSLNLAPSLNWKLSEADALSSENVLSASRTTHDIDEDAMATLGPVPSPADIHTDSGEHRWFVKTSPAWGHDFGEGSHVDVRLGGSASSRDADDDAAGRSAAGQPVLQRHIDEQDSTRVWNGSAKWRQDFGEDHRVTYGAELDHDSETDRRTIDVPLDDQGLPAWNASERVDAHVQRTAGFVQDEWTVSPQLSLYGGVREESLHTQAGDGSGDISHGTSVWSPILQGLWKFGEKDSSQVRVGLTRTYKAPTTDELLPMREVNDFNSAANPRAQGNPALKPELAQGLDVSFEHFVGRNGLVSLSGSVRRIRDVIVRETSTASDGSWISMPVNNGDATARNLELEVKWPLKDLLHNPIELRGSVSRNWSTVDAVPGPDNRIAGQRALDATLGFDYADGPWSGGASYTFSSGGPLRVSPQQVDTASVRHGLDVYGLWKFDPRTGLRLTMVDLLHGEGSITSSDYTAADGSSFERRTDALRSLFVRLTLEASF